MKEDFSIGQCNGLKLDINQKIDSTKVNATAKAAAAYASKQAAEERKAKLGIHNERY
jgi:hypothetical protein